MGMKHFGEMRTMQSREHGVWGPIIELLIGAALIYLPSSVQGVMSTFWTSTNPYAYLTSSTALNSAFVDACYSVIQLIGVIAFIRGLIMLQQAGSERAQPHMLGKALSHLVGGILCINLYGTIQTLEATVGMISS
jgi:intracellular multiplication protein IcmC